jgi:hypothetical protein
MGHHAGKGPRERGMSAASSLIRHKACVRRRSRGSKVTFRSGPEKPPGCAIDHHSQDEIRVGVPVFHPVAQGFGLRIGGDFDLAAKERIRFPNVFRRERIELNQDLSQAGTFPARAVMEVIEAKQPEALAQHLDVPDDTAGWMPRPD